MEVYVFSGLGADKRVFQFLDFSFCSVTFIDWILPEENETIEDYASRIRSQITTVNPTLVGLSFGGIIAVEVAKQIKTDKVVLISSAKNKEEIPFYFRLLGKLKIHKIVPINLLKSSSFIANWFFGATSDFEKDLLKQILIETDSSYLRWAIDKIVGWENKTEISNCTHIHGTHDKILPIRFVNVDIKIDKGGHFMVLNKADEINSILFQNIPNRKRPTPTK
jgi:pimeloyl-ACP methyl ester carboxylesterase